MKKFAVIALLMLLFSCSSTSQHHKKQQLLERVNQYFNLYKTRQDFNQFMSFYHPEAVLEDIVYGNYIEGRTAIKRFLDWPNPNFSLTEQNNALVIEQQIIQGNIVVTEGYFTPFTFYNENMGPWRFIMWHEFNDNLEIIRQVDWINYTPKSKFTEGENLNDRILKTK